MNTLKQLERYGQSPWLDDLHRDLIRKGELARLIKEDGLKGMTSNPAIFEKAIDETDEYKDQLEELLGKRELDDMRVYEALAIEDIQDAADLFQPVYEASSGQDGFVSLEVSPRVANETHKMVEEATRLWSLVERENLMVKIPGTKAGVPAVERAIASGINVNITLLFSIEAYEAVVQSYMSGLEHLIEGGGDPSKIASVASFFLSRIDTAVDKYLDGLPGADEALVDKVTDKVAIASAKLAYARYKTPRWQALAAKGAKRQRLLWASTSTKKKSPAQHLLHRCARRPRHGEHDADRNPERVPRAREARSESPEIGCGPAPGRHSTLWTSSAFRSGQLPPNCSTTA